MQIFDSIAHPTIDGNWFNKPSDNTFENLVTDYRLNNIIGGCAVSLPFISIEELDLYFKKCKRYISPLIYPVAAFNFTEDDFEAKIIAIKEMGYEAIKIHIRLSKLDIDKDFAKLKQVFLFCEKYDLVIFFCTYCHTSIEFTPIHPLSFYLITLLKFAPKVKVVLLHGGDVSLMQFAQLARFNANILIDLSYTFIMFKASSIENDIVFLMNNLDKKICFGSDYPEYPISKFKSELDFLSEKVVDKSKLENIYYKNVMNFLSIEK